MTHDTRREFLQSTLATLLAGGIAQATLPAAGQQPDLPEHMKKLPAHWHGNETVAMLLYPGFTALDLFGPHHAFISMMGAKVMLVAKDEQPVESDSKVKVHPHYTFATCPENVTILFVPGGTSGTLAAALDEDTRKFVADRGSKAKWVTSVCTGSLVLGAAGLLEGYKATSHWIVREELALFGAIPTDQRVVVDRNRMTGAGVTSGIDFGLRLVKDLRGKDYAQAVQLFSEYDPQPPLDAGSPSKCPKELVTLLKETHLPFNEEVRKMARSVRRTAP
ncbi:MAG: DJ-1/PfpI family protein [Pirellulales bacterium]